MRFPKSARITKAGEFSDLLRNGRRRNGSAVSICWRPGAGRRLGIAVSRKIKGSARKNRIKRVVREVFRTSPETFPLGDVIVIAKMGTDALTNHQIRKVVHDLLDR